MNPVQRLRTPEGAARAPAARAHVGHGDGRARPGAGAPRGRAAGARGATCWPRAPRPTTPRSRRASAPRPRAAAREACRLSFDLAERWAADVLAFLRGAGVAPAEVDALASHGQTLFHAPRAVGGGRAVTLQVGDGDVLAERTGILTVTDFRPRDVAAGRRGRAADPLRRLVPVGPARRGVGLREPGQHRQRDRGHGPTRPECWPSTSGPPTR